MYKMDLALNNLQWLICHKTKRNQTNNNPSYLELHVTSWFKQFTRESPRDVVINILDYDMNGSEFEFQPRSCIHFRNYIQGKVINLLISMAMG